MLEGSGPCSSLFSSIRCWRDVKLHIWGGICPLALYKAKVSPVTWHMSQAPVWSGRTSYSLPTLVSHRGATTATTARVVSIPRIVFREIPPWTCSWLGQPVPRVSSSTIIESSQSFKLFARNLLRNYKAYNTCSRIEAYRHTSNNDEMNKQMCHCQAAGDGAGAVKRGGKVCTAHFVVRAVRVSEIQANVWLWAHMWHICIN